MVTRVNKAGQTELHLLARDDKNASLVNQWLLRHPVEHALVVDKSWENALHIACRHGSARILELLLQHAHGHAHADAINAQSRGKGDTPLVLAACHGHTRCAELLLQSGRCDVALVTRQGYDAAMWATKSGLPQLAEIIVSHRRRQEIAVDEHATV